MFYLNPVGRMIMVATLVMPTLALSEPVTLSYFARVELVMIASEDADFECTNDKLPAKIEIDEDTFGSTSANLPPTLLNRPMPAQINVRRGVELAPEIADRVVSGFTDDWYMTVMGEIGFCVGLATLQVMQGNLEAFVQLGQYEATILSSDDVLRDLHIKYDTNAAQQRLAYFFNLRRDGFPSQMSAQFVGQLPEYEVDDAQILGRLDFDATQLTVRLADPNNLEDVTHLTRLNIGLVLEGSASESPQPNARINENVDDEG